MPVLVTAAQLRAVLGVPNTLYDDTALNAIIDTSEDAIGDFLIQWKVGIDKHYSETATETTIHAKINMTITCGVAYLSNPASLDNLEQLIFSVLAVIPDGYTVGPVERPSVTQVGAVNLLVAQLPIRTAVMSDVNGLQAELVEDLMMEFSQLEAQSMASNNDQAGSTTTTTGATNGLRGLNYYLGAAGAVSAFGTSGTAITNGIHTIATVGHVHTAIDYATLVDIANALPGQYWSLPGTAWMMSPSAIQEIRKDTTGSGGHALIETGTDDGGAGVFIFGFPVIVNPYLDAFGSAGAMPIYLANWDRFMTIADVEEMTVQAMEQTAPGFITLYAEKRMVSTVRDPFAGVRLIGT